MKKILFTIIAILATTAAFAEDPAAPASPFKYSGAAYAYGAQFKTTTKDQSAAYGGYRFRPYFSYLTENVEATVKFEIDQVFGGSKDNSKTSADGKQQADVGNDEKALEVKAAFLKFKVPAVAGLSIKGGADEYKTVGGFTCGTELGLGLINYKADMFDITFAAAKVWEPSVLDTKKDTTTEKDDVTFYAADATLTLSDSIKIRPALYAIQGEKNQVDSKVPFTGKTAFIPSLGANLKFGSVSVDLAAAYGTCGKDETDTKYSGYAIDLAPSFKASDAFTLNAFFTMLSGDKATSTDKNESFKSFTLKQDGWGRLFILEDQMTFNNADTKFHAYGDVRGYETGYYVIGANAIYKMSAIEIKGQAGYGQLSKVASGEKKDLGVEFDASISYEIEKNAKLIVEGAYLATGKAFGETGGLGKSTKKQAALYAALGMSYKW